MRMSNAKYQRLLKIFYIPFPFLLNRRIILPSIFSVRKNTLVFSSYENNVFILTYAVDSV